jgi:2-hydroxy-3-oxopropionate reductase
MRDKSAIGFIGTGIMGSPMAHHLLKAGYSLQVWNRSADKLESLREAGAIVCVEPYEVARGISTLICMLSDGPTCDEVLFGKDGVASAMESGTAIVVMSSMAVSEATAQAEKAAALGIRYLDAPVSGGENGARNASLAIMVGGSKSDFHSVEPLLRVLGRPTHVGPPGCGELIKLVNQMIVASTIATVSEALLLAEQGGANPAVVREALAGGFADSVILQQHGKRMVERSFAPGGPAKYQLKDTRNATNYANAIGLSLPVATLVNSLFEDMVKHGDGELDHSALIREIRRRNHLNG